MPTRGAERLITLLGPGGVGKTTIAVALGRQLEPVFADGAQFVDLSAVQDEAMVVSTIASTLEIEDPLLDPEDTLEAITTGAIAFALVFDLPERIERQLSPGGDHGRAETPSATAVSRDSGR